MFPWNAIIVQMRFNNGIKGPSADNFMRLRADIRRVELVGRQRLCINLRADRAGRPGVHDVLIRGDFLACVTFRQGSKGVARELVRIGVEQFAFLSSALGVPYRKRNAKEALAAYAPIFLEAIGPLVEADFHELRVPVAHRRLVFDGIFLIDDTHKPLVGWDDFNRRTAALSAFDGLCFF